MLFALAFGALSLLHKDVEDEVMRWIDMLRIDPDNRYIAGTFRTLRFVHTTELKQLTALTFFYAGLFLTEGIGLALQKRWAEWLTVVATVLFIPVEIYELCKEATTAKGIALVINVFVVVFLIYLIRQKNRDQ